MVLQINNCPKGGAQNNARMVSAKQVQGKTLYAGQTNASNNVPKVKPISCWYRTIMLYLNSIQVFFCIIINHKIQYLIYFRFPSEIGMCQFQNFFILNSIPKEYLILKSFFRVSKSNKQRQKTKTMYVQYVFNFIKTKPGEFCKLCCEIALEKYILDLIIRTRHVILLKVCYDNLPTAKVLSHAEKATLNIESTQVQAMVSNYKLQVVGGGGYPTIIKGRDSPNAQLLPRKPES